MPAKKVVKPEQTQEQRIQHQQPDTERYQLRSLRWSDAKHQVFQYCSGVSHWRSAATTCFALATRGSGCPTLGRNTGSRRIASSWAIGTRLTVLLLLVW